LDFWLLHHKTSGLLDLWHTRPGLGLHEEVCELLEGGLGEDGLLPQVWGEIAIGLSDGSIGGLGEVTKGSGLATGGGVAVLNTGHLQQLLGDGGTHNAGTTGSGDQTHQHGTTLASHLHTQNRHYILAAAVFHLSIHT
jgi:hypothetical protein